MDSPRRRHKRRWIRGGLLLCALAGVAACGDDDGGNGNGNGNGLQFVVLTFNSGTSEGLGHGDGLDDGYSTLDASYSDLYYGDGLAWSPAVEATTAFFADVSPDVVVFQEIFYTGDCSGIPPEALEKFICDTWQPGDPTVAQLVLGEGYQVMCNPGNNDKCAAVKRAFGSFRGCAGDFCLEGMEGFRVNDCGHGARVGRAVIELVAGGELTLVNYHGSSGIDQDEMDCRRQQVDQVFVDLGDGEPGANGARNLIMGDLNTDPGRLASMDPSALRWTDFVGEGLPFHFITEVGMDAEPTYQGIVNIDHVMSDTATGTCWVAGLDGGPPPIIEATYFDHLPIVCTVQM
ncbi:MAG: hypothetical protein ABI333_29700 [bacterium]